MEVCAQCFSIYSRSCRDCAMHGFKVTDERFNELANHIGRRFFQHVGSLPFFLTTLFILLVFQGIQTHGQTAVISDGTVFLVRDTSHHNVNIVTPYSHCARLHSHSVCDIYDCTHFIVKDLLYSSSATAKLLRSSTVRKYTMLFR